MSYLTTGWHTFPGLGIGIVGGCGGVWQDARFLFGRFPPPGARFEAWV